MSLAGAVLVAWALLALGVTLTALVRVRARKAPAKLRVSGAEVVVLRPVDSPSATELENLAQPLPPGFRHLVLSPFRPRLAPGVEWLPSDPPTQNRKLGHLQYALEVLAAHRPDGADEAGFRGASLQRVLLIDSDVRVDEALLADLLGALDQGAAAAWAAPLPESADTTRGVLVQSMHAFDVLSAISADPAPLCGKALALGSSALAVFRRLPDCVGEDLELATRLHEQRLRLDLVGQARMPGVGAAPLQRFTRWMQVLRAHRPWQFPAVPLLFACTPMLVALAAWVREPAATALVLMVVASRTLVAMRAERGQAPSRSVLWWLPGEVVLLAAWCLSVWRGGTVSWRGRTLVLRGGGRLASTALAARP